jgi:hypothetical protein
MTGDRTATALHFGLGRSQGIELGYRGDDVRVRAALSEGAEDNLFSTYKLATTQPINSPYYQNQSDLSVSARAEWKLMGAWSDFDRMTSPPGEQSGLLAGLGFHWQRNKVYLNQTAINLTQSVNSFGIPVSANNYNDWIGLTADLTWNLGGATITASGYYHNVNSGSSYLIQNFNLISGNQDFPGTGANPTFDVGTIEMFGVSIYGSTYITPEIELFAGLDWMDVTSGDFAALAVVGDSGSLGAYNAYTKPDPYTAITFGGTWYIDGEDLKFGTSCTFAPSEVSPNWVTPQLGIRSTPSSDMYVFRAYFQLLF